MNWTRSARMLAMAALGYQPAVLWGAPGDGLANTAHDFTTNANVTLSGGPGSIGLCTFCHTPHSAKSTRLLWNHTLSSNNFSWNDAPTTMGGTILPTLTRAYAGPSTKCLSCHDGSVAIGDVGSFRPGAGVLSADRIGTNGFALTRQVGAGGDLSGSHPVGVPYPLYNTPNTYNGITSGAQLVMGDWVADPTGNNIRLYADDGSGNIAGGKSAGATGVECSSCHDPHNRAAKDRAFLRGMLSGGTQASGYLCLQCHNKR